MVYLGRYLYLLCYHMWPGIWLSTNIWTGPAWSRNLYDEWVWFCCEPHQQCDQIWQNFATLAKFSSLWPFLEGLFRIWQNVEHTLGIFLRFWANSIVVNGQILNKLLSNLDTLLTSVKVGRNKMLTICLISCHKSWIVFWSRPTSASFNVYFRSFQTTFTDKTESFSGIRSWIVRV